MHRLGWLNLMCSIGLAVAQSGCGEVEHCQPGEPGCVEGPPTDGGVCRFDLVARNNKCVTPDRLDDVDNRPKPDPCGPCENRQTCTTDRKECVDFCSQDEVLPGTEEAPEPIRCGGEIKNAATGETFNLTFDETCISNCQWTCRLRDWFCSVGCDKGACDAPEVLADCHKRCDGANSPLSCVQSLCNDTRASGCSTAEGFCPNGETADCSAIECKNSCASTAYDGQCDDGDLFNATSGSCSWGSDCADCGPREGEDFSHGLKQGAACSLQEQCAGYSSDYAKNEAFCAQVVPGKPLRRCVLDCSGKDELCPVGTTCTTLRVKDEDGESKPLRDANQVSGHACLPDVCL